MVTETPGAVGLGVVVLGVAGAVDTVPVAALVDAAPAAGAPPGVAQAAVPAISDNPAAAATNRPRAAGAILGRSRRARRPGRPGRRAISPTAMTIASHSTSSQAVRPAVISRID
jgi:hypothetical protein